ncbi:VTT domain-containing protein [Vibrio sp. SCSIO 43135]|uniref:TVP38/TMEM64 family protein n=1 Tax=Vibrio sp. SCSIO 43135 TaxID=2819096 RepID=UPI002075BEB8|nr:VTT domain-containing protein [Vibrio sp. SCSIO 43135]USD42729.1 VTT domain-containing protein [Vibrio sp. SCSIO 43135]
MSSMIKVLLVLALAFASTFILLNAIGVLNVEKIERWFELAQSISPLYIFAIAVLLLTADLFVAMPTLTITLLAGFFLGQWFGALAATSGMTLAGLVGYGISFRYGEKLLLKLLKEKTNIAEAKQAFNQHGFTMILLSRATPILPEVTACLAGASGMKLSKFMLAWTISTVPYCLIAAYAGSISSMNNPKPALIAAALMTGILWLGWYWFRRQALAVATK